MTVATTCYKPKPTSAFVTNSETGSLYASGKTAAETAIALNKNMRNYDNNPNKRDRLTITSPHRKGSFKVIYL